MSGAPTFRALLGPILEAQPPRHHLEVTFADATVAIASNSRALVDKLAAYYRDFLGQTGATIVSVTAIEAPPPEFGLPLTLKEPDPGKTRIKEAFVDLPDGRVVRKLLTGLVFLFGHGANYAVGPCLANENQVVNFINNRFIELRLRRGALLFHAAGVAEGRAGLVLSGFAGAGKSTLALELMRHGMDFVSNDRMLVSREGRELTMTGVAKMPRVNPGTALHNPSLAPVMSEEDRRRFAALPLDALWNLEHKYDVRIDRCFGPGRFRLSCPMAGLVVLHWKRGAAPMTAGRASLRDRRELMAAFMKDPGLFYELDEPDAPTAAGEEAYLDLLGDLPVLAIEGGVDFPRATQACLDFLREARS